jgi:uncharacterized protein
MKRILSLDGGGIRGIFSLEILLHIQQLLRDQFKDPERVLADHFDFFAGTSTGAIIAAALSWGLPVEEILALYEEHGKAMFQPVTWRHPLRRLFVSRYDATKLSEMLRDIFSEDAKDGTGKVPSLLGTSKLKTLLLVVMRNHTTGSAWPITNNPKAKYNQPELPDCNLNIPLWQVVRASTAAPVYFDPEEIMLGGKRHVFVDGAMTPYNNPALIAALTAILPCYNLNWETGPDRIRLISVGTIRFALAAADKNIRRMWVGYNLPRIPLALIQGIGLEQDYLCRCFGQCLHGEDLDDEIGNLENASLPGRNWFSYVRYNRSFLRKEVEELLRQHPQLAQIDAVHAMPLLKELGQTYAQEHVKVEHLI